jgi:pseudouridine-5'-phosphate glycosidase
MTDFLYFLPDVAAARSAGRPIVALESTVIVHGLPYPHNLETARQMEAAIRAAGATPATIAILGGQVSVGLTRDQLAYLATADGAAVRKCSRRDLPLAIARHEDGATTVAGTMVVAHLAGIELMATGGIGGVHRGHPFDVSADLNELGRTPVAVVCSGVKAILDLPLTREALETQGVPVVGYGTDEMPAFFARSSGLAADARVDSPAEAAALIEARRGLELRSGLLFTVPVPSADTAAEPLLDEAMAQAIEEADREGILGPAASPWLLRRVNELTGGRSLQANVALLVNNARVAGEIAAALHRTREQNSA